MANRNTILFKGKLLNREQQALLFSCNFFIDNIIEIQQDQRILNAYYYHLNFNKRITLNNLFYKFKQLNMKPELCTILTNYGKYKYTAIILVYIPNLCLRYLKNGASNNLKLKIANKITMF